MEMPFGKYRGTQIRELPFNYLEWLTTLEPLATRVQEEYGHRLHDQSRDGAIDFSVVDEIVSAGVRSLAKAHHPDTGGNHQRMVVINNAADWLREKARN